MSSTAYKARRAKGLCGYCGKKPLEGQKVCADCDRVRVFSLLLYRQATARCDKKPRTSRKQLEAKIASAV